MRSIGGGECVYLSVCLYMGSMTMGKINANQSGISIAVNTCTERGAMHVVERWCTVYITSPKKANEF